MFSPTTIANFLACQHLTALDRAEAAGEIKRPFFADPLLDFLIKLGQAHEQAYLTQLTEQGLTIVEIPTDGSRRDAAARTVEAIRGGADVIYQATFLDDQWYGRADFLIRVDKPSELGAFSYEVVETKLARSTKARAIIQLCFYSDLLSTIQGVMPDYMHVVLGGGAKPERFFVQRYLAFFRKIKRDFVAAEHEQGETYPEPVEHCRICDWSTVCDAQWRKDDHLSLIANISRNQRQALVAYGTETVAGLARLPVLPEPEVGGINDQAFANIHQQARLIVGDLRDAEGPADEAEDEVTNDRPDGQQGAVARAGFAVGGVAAIVATFLAGLSFARMHREREHRVDAVVVPAT